MPSQYAFSWKYGDSLSSICHHWPYYFWKMLSVHFSGSSCKHIALWNINLCLQLWSKCVVILRELAMSPFHEGSLVFFTEMKIDRVTILASYLVWAVLIRCFQVLIEHRKKNQRKREYRSIRVNEEGKSIQLLILTVISAQQCGPVWKTECQKCSPYCLHNAHTYLPCHSQQVRSVTQFLISSSPVPQCKKPLVYAAQILLTRLEEPFGPGSFWVFSFCNLARWQNWSKL